MVWASVMGRFLMRAVQCCHVLGVDKAAVRLRHVRSVMRSGVDAAHSTLWPSLRALYSTGRDLRGSCLAQNMGSQLQGLSGDLVTSLPHSWSNRVLIQYWQHLRVAVGAL